MGLGVRQHLPGLVLHGSASGSIPMGSEASLLKNDNVMLIKCRIEPAGPHQGTIFGDIGKIPP